MITQSDILDALRQALVQPGGEEGFTVAELSRALGIGEDNTRNRLKALMAAGQVENIRVARPRMDGVVQKVAGYRLK